MGEESKRVREPMREGAEETGRVANGRAGGGDGPIRQGATVATRADGSRALSPKRCAAEESRVSCLVWPARYFGRKGVGERSVDSRASLLSLSPLPNPRRTTIDMTSVETRSTVATPYWKYCRP